MKRDTGIQLELFKTESTNRNQLDYNDVSLSNYRPKCLDLFCGAGGMSLGFEESGFDIVGGVEIDPVHAGVHQYNFPYCRIIRDDIHNLNGKTLLNELGRIDIIIGGPPCQGFSMIGKREENDNRNGLVMEYMRLVSEIKPKYFVMENVSGLTVGYGKKYLEDAIGFIKSNDYDIVMPYKVLNAADYGVPQNRKRLFLLGYRSDQIAPKYPQLNSDLVTVADAIDDLPNIEEFEALINDDNIEYSVRPISEYARNLHVPEEDCKNFGYNRIWNKNLITGSLRTNHTELSRKRFRETLQGETEKISRFLKLNPNGQCNTLRAGTDRHRGAYTGPRPIHPYHDRCISVREAERLHSFPDWFRMHKTKWHGFREVGNSVPPLLAKAVGDQILKAMKINPVKPSELIPLGDESLLSLSTEEALRGENKNGE